VPLDLLAVQLDPRPVALWVLLAFALGGFAGLAASMAAIVKLQSGQRSLRRQLGKQTRQAAANTGQKT
jgi:hypothetical protein